MLLLKTNVALNGPKQNNKSKALCTYLLVWVMKQKVVITLSVYTVEASNKDQAMLMDIRKKDMINNLKVIMTFVIIEPLDWPTAFYGVCSQQFAK